MTQPIGPESKFLGPHVSWKCRSPGTRSLGHVVLGTGCAGDRLWLRTGCVTVGSEKAPYHVHSQLLSDNCPYFKGRADFWSKSQLDNQNSISFEDTTCEVFDILYEYVYTSVYNTAANLITAEKCELNARVYFFADFLMMDELKKMALSKMKTLLRTGTWSTQSNLTTQAIIRLLDVVYESTAGEPALLGTSWKEDADVEDETSEKNKTGSAPPSAFERPQSDSMRMLVARYAASRIESLRNDEDF